MSTVDDEAPNEGRGIRLPRIVGSLLAATGFVTEVKGDDSAEEAEPQAKPVAKAASARRQPSIETDAPTADHRTAAGAANVDAQAMNLGTEYLGHILASAPAAFQKFLETREVMKETLGDSLSGETLERKATQAAIKTSKITAADVSAAVAYMREALGGKRKEFTAELEQRRREKVEGPQAEIDSAEDRIQALEAQKAQIDSDIASLRSGIEPKRQAIIAAQTKLKDGELVFDRSCDFVEGRISVMETELQNALKGGK